MSSQGTVIVSAACRQDAASSKSAPRAAACRGWRATASAAARRFRCAIRFVYTLLSAIALYSSGPVTPSIRNGPARRGGRANARAARLDEQLQTDLRSKTASPSRPGTARPRRRCRRRCGTPPCRPASIPSTPGRGSCARGRRHRRGRAGPRARVRGRASSGASEGVGGRPRRGVGQHGQDEALAVPERVAVVARAGQTLGADRALLGAGAGLERVEEREADCLLQLGVPVQLDIGARPEVVEVGALRFEQAVPAGVPRLGQRGDGQISDRRQRAPARRAVRQELHDPQLLSRGRSAAIVTRPTSGAVSVDVSVLLGPSTRWSIAAASRSLLNLVECTSTTRFS